MNTWLKTYVVSLLAAVPLGAQQAEPKSPEMPLTKASIIEIVEGYLLDNPEIIAKAAEKLQEKQIAAKKDKDRQVIADNHQELFGQVQDHFIGEKTAKNTVVAFVDPYCGHCRHFHQMLTDSLTPKDDLRVVLKDFPLFGEPSQLAVAALTAAQMQNKYFDYDKALGKQNKQLSKKELTALAKTVKGLDFKKFEKDMDSEDVKSIIKNHVALAEKLGVTGTPVLVVADTIIEGGVSLDIIKKTIEDAQKPEATAAPTAPMPQG